MISTKQRQQAIDWLASKDRSFAEGLSILRESRFKPGVTRRLQTIGETPANRMHLEENIRLYLRFMGDDVPDSDAELGVIDGAQPEELDSESDTQDSLLILADKYAGGDTTMPESVGAMLITYAKAYREREQGHRLLSDIPEDNSEENCQKRKDICTSIDRLTDKLEQIYPHVKAYLDNGTVPTEDAVVAAAAPLAEKQESSDTVPAKETDLDSLTKEELQARLKSAKQKILKKSNLLLYQQESKPKDLKENPMPECPKRTKLETAIEALKKEVESLQYAIARKG